MAQDQIYSANAVQQLDLASIRLPLEVDDDAQDSYNGSISTIDRYTSSKPHATDRQSFHYENGRRYHSFADSRYALPNDEVESARLDIQHEMWKLTFDGLGMVPITESTERVLDLGTGTGIWAIEFALAHPDIEVVGTDLSLIQPESGPENCQFEVHNAEQDWNFDKKFNYIHSRMLTIGIQDWSKLFERAWGALEPGGWLEICDTRVPSGSIENFSANESAFIRWSHLAYDALATIGVDGRASEGFAGLLEKQGFVNVEKVDIQWPIGPWAKGERNKTLGKLTRKNSIAVVPAIAGSLFTKCLGWTKADVDAFVTECMKDLNTKDRHFYFPMQVVSKLLARPRTNIIIAGVVSERRNLSIRSKNRI